MSFELEILKRIQQLEAEVARLKTRELPITHGLGDLTDPGSDKILFWDESEDALGWLEPNTNLSITATDLDAS